MKLKLLKISTSTTQNVFHISIKKDNTDPVHTTFLTDTEKTTDFYPIDKKITKYNKNSLYSDFGVIYYNMYDSTTPWYKSSFYKTSQSKRTDMTYDFQDTVNHKLSNHIIDSVLFLNYIYMLEPNTEYGHLTLSTELYNWLSTDTGSSIPPVKKIDTYIYDKKQLSYNIKNNILSDNSISVTLNNVKYNMIYEIPGNIYNDYESGNIIAHVFKGKNQYDCEYNMCYDDLTLLSCIRTYINIDSCNNQLYLKYDNKDSIETVNSELRSYNKKHNKYGITLPNIEIIKSINRTNNIDQHPTSLYSIDIDVRKMFEHIVIDNKVEEKININKVKENVKFEIQNCVRAIVETILPVNTQLFHVYVNGE